MNLIYPHYLLQKYPNIFAGRTLKHFKEINKAYHSETLRVDRLKVFGSLKKEKTKTETLSHLLVEQIFPGFYAPF